jgi:c-di-GMP-binding flagellar brake protein YcgR
MNSNSAIFYCLSADAWEPGQWFKNSSTPLERAILFVLLGLFAAVVLYNFVRYVRISRIRKLEAWKKFFAVSVEKGLKINEQNMLVNFIRDYGIHPPTRIFSDSRLFDSCAVREIEKVKSRPLSYIDKKMRAYQIGLLRRKLGYTISRYNKYLETSRELEPGQEVSIKFDTPDGKDHFFRSSVVATNEMEFVIIVPPDIEAMNSLLPGGAVQTTFLQPGLARYEMTCLILEKNPYYLHLEHAENLKVVQERRFVRAEINGMATFRVIRTPDGRSSNMKYAGQVLDISAGGLGFSFNRPIPDGTELELDLDFGERKFTKIGGAVLRSYEVEENAEKYMRVHLYFTKMTEKQQDEIFKFIFKQHYSKE